MEKEHSLEEIRMKAHRVNCDLYEEGFSAREIEVIGYYLNRIAASYLSYFTHEDIEKKIKNQSTPNSADESYKHVKLKE